MHRGEQKRSSLKGHITFLWAGADLVLSPWHQDYDAFDKTQKADIFVSFHFRDISSIQQQTHKNCRYSVGKLFALLGPPQKWLRIIPVMHHRHKRLVRKKFLAPTDIETV